MMLVVEDPEVQAMEALVRALENLDDTRRDRVIRWAAARWGVGLAAAGPKRHSIGGEHHEHRAADSESAGHFETLPELFDAANPVTDVMRALLAGYWFQVCRGQSDFTGQQVNDELKQLGHPLSNVTQFFRLLQNQSPALARQVKKSGSSRQARKQYQLTHGGIKKVQAMISGEAPQEE